MSKRGQLSLFMIIGIVLVLSIGLLAYFVTMSQSQDTGTSINLDQKKQSVAEFIESCFSHTLKEARNKQGLDEDKIESYVDENICKDFSEFEEEDLSITFTGAKTNVGISQSTITASMDYFIMMRLGLASQSLEEFSFNMEVTTMIQIPTQAGVVTEDTVLRSGDGLLELFVAEGTLIKDENGNPVDNPEIVIELTDVDPNPTTYGDGIYEIEPHLSFSQSAVLRLRYYNLNLGPEENLKVIKRPGPGYVWKIVEDQDPPYVENNLVLARLDDLSEIALTVTCGSGEETEDAEGAGEGEEADETEENQEAGETTLYFYTNYIYLQNCEPCKCFEERGEEDKQYYLDADVFNACEDKTSVGPELEEAYDYSEKDFSELLLEERGFTLENQNERCKFENGNYYYETFEDVGGNGSFNLEFTLGADSCISEVNFEKNDVDDAISSITMEGDTFTDWSAVFEKVKDDVVKGSETYSKTIDVEVLNTADACSHERLLVEIKGTDITCPPAEDIKPARCCKTLEECDWGAKITAEFDFTGCNKLGFHTLVQDTGDTALVNRHLEVVKEFSGEGGWALNLDYEFNQYSPSAYVSTAVSLGLRPIIRVDRLTTTPSDQDIADMASHVNSISGLKYVQFLNEPNHPDSYIEPQEYARLLKEFHSKADSNIRIIAGNLAPNQGHATADTINYIQSMFSGDPEEVAEAFDIWGSHSYPSNWAGEIGPDCTGDGCPINSVYAYRKEVAKIENLLGLEPGDFDKPIIITETGYKLSAESEENIANYMLEAFNNVWNPDQRVIGVTIFILAPIGSEWTDHLWATIPLEDPENYNPTAFFTAVQQGGHEGAVCMADTVSAEEPEAPLEGGEEEPESLNGGEEQEGGEEI